MHLQLIPAIGALAHQHRVVEVARRLAINRHDRQIAKISATRNLFEIEVRNAARLRQHLLRKHARQLMLADHHLHVNAKVIRIAKHFNDAPHRRPRRRGPAGDLHIHHQAFQIVERVVYLGSTCISTILEGYGLQPVR